MAKVFTYIVIMTLIMLLLYTGGFLNNSQLGAVANLTSVNPVTGEVTITDYSDTLLFKFVVSLITILALAVVAGVVASFFGASFPSEGVLLAQGVGAGSFLFLFAASIWNAMKQVNATSCTSGICGPWVTWLVILICLPIGMGYIWSVIEWLRGGD